jgi:hypothetical protein
MVTGSVGICLRRKYFSPYLPTAKENPWPLMVVLVFIKETKIKKQLG